jgi:predicted amidohydrolase
LEEREYKFTGKSQIVDPMIKILVRSKENIEEVKVVKIDIKKARNKKLNKYNDLIKDRKPIFYKRIIKP